MDCQNFSLEYLRARTRARLYHVFRVNSRGPLAPKRIKAGSLLSLNKLITNYYPGTPAGGVFLIWHMFSQRHSALKKLARLHAEQEVLDREKELVSVMKKKAREEKKKDK